MRTRAVRDGSDWILTGNKMWIANGSIADVVIEWARTEAGIRGFVVSKEAPVVSTQDVHHKLSLRPSTTSEPILEAVHLPTDVTTSGRAHRRSRVAQVRSPWPPARSARSRDVLANATV
jgi:glutaryl-CoA dehydrogenase